MVTGPLRVRDTTRPGHPVPCSCSVVHRAIPAILIHLLSSERVVHLGPERVVHLLAPERVVRLAPERVVHWVVGRHFTLASQDSALCKFGSVLL